MYKNMIALQEEEALLVYGGRDAEVAEFVKLVGKGLGLLAKIIYKTMAAIADNLAYADIPGCHR